MHNTFLIPCDKTLSDILSEIGTTACHSSEFIEINKYNMVRIGRMDSLDYEVFWKCMRIFEATKINYFSDYLSLRSGEYGSFSDGIDQWFNSRSIMGWFPSSEQFLKIVTLLRFFEINSYDGVPLSEFEEKSKYALHFEQTAHQNELQRRQLQSDESIKKRISNYFNFDNYSEDKYTELFQELRLRQESSVSINEALAYARYAPHSTYIVILKRDNEVCYIGKTEQPLYYIGSRHKKLKADAAYIGVVDAEYADDLVIGLKVLFDFELEKIRPSHLNRKYTTVKQAVFAYKRSESIPRKTVLAAIRNNHIRSIDLGNEQILIDKIELHRALYSSNSSC